MNEVLKNWVEIKLEKICSRITKGGTPTTYGYAFQKEGINFIKVENLNKGTVDLRSISDFISQEAHDFQKKSQLQAGDLLFSIAGTIGETCIVKKEILPANTNQALAIIQGFDRVLLPNFLKFQLDSFVARKVTSKARGGAMNNVSLGDLKNLDVLIPPKPEQRAIVAKIEQLFSELDNGIANLKAAKDKLEIYRQAVLKNAFEGDFTTEYRLSKTGSSEKIKWESDNLKNRTTQITKGSTPTTYGYKYLDDGINFIKVENITNGKVDLNSITQFIGEDAHEFQKRSQLAVNDILFSIAGTIGETVILKEEHLPANTNQALAIIRGFEESLLPEYLLYLLRSFVALKVKSKARGGAMNNVSLGDLKKLDILIPPKDEQKVILSEIESRLSVCDNILANIEEGLDKSEALRHSILKQAFEGKLLSEEELEACRKEPDWEPAEQLLARIKAGKETSVKKEKAPAKQTPKKKIHHVEYYKRTLLAAEIVWQLHRQPTLGHLKLQKLIYLCQESGNMQLPTNFLQQAAGPYDPQMARSIDKQLKTKKWFTFRKNELLKYEPLKKKGGHQTDFEKYFAKDINNIQKVIGLFRTAKSDQIEIVATLYACWKKIIREKAVFSEDLLIKRFYEWSEEKSKYPESRVKKAVEWMREKGIVPVNAGKQTIDE